MYNLVSGDNISGESEVNGKLREIKIVDDGFGYFPMQVDTPTGSVLLRGTWVLVRVLLVSAAASVPTRPSAEAAPNVLMKFMCCSILRLRV